MGFIWFIIIALLIAKVIFNALSGTHEDSQEQQQQEQHAAEVHSAVNDQERKRYGSVRDGTTYANLTIDAASAQRYFPRSNTIVIQIIQPNDGTVHFLQDSNFTNLLSPDFQLINIEYRPAYGHETKSTIASKRGAALVGGILAGSAGATIRTAGKRKVASTTIDNEVNTLGYLTLRCVNQGTYYGREYRVAIVINSDIYNKLNTRFMSDFRKTVLSSEHEELATD